MNKKPRFFCENCNAEVDHGAKACPNCGRFFTSVRCPSCGFIGEENIFVKGCPSCGYSAQPSPAVRPIEKKVPAGPLPLWAYIFSVAALIVVLAVLYFKLAA